MKTKLTGLFLILTFGLFLVLSTGCKKEEDAKGTLNLDNYTSYSLRVTWKGGTYSVGALGYTSHSVTPGSGTAIAYYSDGSVFDSGTFTIPDGGTLTLYLYEYKDGQHCLMQEKDVSIGK